METNISQRSNDVETLHVSRQRNLPDSPFFTSISVGSTQEANSFEAPQLSAGSQNVGLSQTVTGI